ncbi:MAG TPA: cytochrome b [Rhodocyclaceae bacterium]|nr:cytochrome b [Rhodocyclaceae bacterium]
MTPARYTRTAMLLHWLMAVLILGMFGLGLYMVDLPLSPQKLKFYSYHKWAGITVLTLALLRVLWRILHQPPALPASQPRWQQFAAHSAHGLLYVLIFVVPLTGWLMSSALGFPVVWFGVLPLPDLIDKDKELGELLKLVHRYLNYTFLVLVVGHALAAIKHHWLDRDGTLNRMLPAPTPEENRS